MWGERLTEDGPDHRFFVREARESGILVRGSGARRDSSGQPLRKQYCQRDLLCRCVPESRAARSWEPGKKRRACLES